MILTKRQQSLFRGNGSGVGTLSARETADAVITALTPAAWYRNATDVVSSGGFASIWADYASSDKGLVLPGVTLNYASAPDSVPLSITGDIELQIRCKLPDYTPAANTSLIGKYTATPQLSYVLWLATNGHLVFAYSYDGTNIRTASSTVPCGVTDGDETYFKSTYDSVGGSVNFYKSTDGTAWTQIGAAVAITAGAIYDGTNTLNIGFGSIGSLNGIVYRAIVKDGIDGTTVFDADFSAQAIGTASFTESSSNAATVTINTSGAAPAHIGKARDLLQGTGTNQPAYAAGVFTFDGADNFMSNAYAMNQPVSVYLVFNPVAWTSTDSVLGNVTNQSVLVWARGVTPRLDLYAGTADVCQNTGFAIGAYKIMAAVLNGASSVLRCNDNADSTGNPGAGTFAGGFRLGSGGGASGSFWANIAAKECVIFEAAHDDTTRDSVVTALNDLFTVF